MFICSYIYFFLLGTPTYGSDNESLRYPTAGFHCLTSYAPLKCLMLDFRCLRGGRSFLHRTVLLQPIECVGAERTTLHWFFIPGSLQLKAFSLQVNSCSVICPNGPLEALPFVEISSQLTSVVASFPGLWPRNSVEKLEGKGFRRSADEKKSYPIRSSSDVPRGP